MNALEDLRLAFRGLSDEDDEDNPAIGDDALEDDPEGTDDEDDEDVEEEEA